MIGPKKETADEPADAAVAALAYPEQELTGKILEASFAVHNFLRAGFLEKVYENALALELQAVGISCEQQTPLRVSYKGKIVGEFLADVIVNGRVLVELKACSMLDSSHEGQILNYLRATGIHVGLLLNFGRPKLQYRRFVI